MATLHTPEELDELEAELSRQVLDFIVQNNLSRGEKIYLLTRVFSQKLLLSAKHIMLEELVK